MDEEMVANLKQFIAGLLAQQITGLRDELKQDILRVEKKIDDLSSNVAEAVDSSNEATAVQIKNHERRIVRLERKTA